MAFFNQTTQQRWQSLIARYFAMKTAGMPAPTISPEIQAGLDINQMDDAAAFWLRGESLWCAAATVAAAVGNFGEANLRNPAGSGVLVIVESFSILATGQIVLAKLQADQGDLASVQTPQPRDTRMVTSPGGSALANCPARLTTRNTSAVAPASPYAWIGYGTIGAEMVNFPIVITPGFELRLWCNTVNTAAYFSVNFRVRAFYPEESQTG